MAFWGKSKLKEGQAPEPEPEPVLLMVQVYGPQGLVDTLVIDEENMSYDETSIVGVTSENKAVYVVGLGGAFFAVVKEK